MDYAELDHDLVFLSQRHLLARDLDRIAPGVPTETERHFLGFAGTGEEAVFGKEARFAKSREAETFSTETARDRACRIHEIVPAAVGRRHYVGL